MSDTAPPLPEGYQYGYCGTKGCHCILGIRKLGEDGKWHPIPIAEWDEVIERGKASV
jgi:hypothetical protein